IDWYFALNPSGGSSDPIVVRTLQTFLDFGVIDYLELPPHLYLPLPPNAFGQQNPTHPACVVDGLNRFVNNDSPVRDINHFHHSPA
ncbi:MAG: hypothetical protein ACKN82_09920, partial [Pirellula sp.]